MTRALEVLVCTVDNQPRAGVGVSMFIRGMNPQFASTGSDGIARFVAPWFGTATVAVAGGASQHVLTSAQRIVIAQ